MPKVQHHKDTTFKSVNKPRNIERIGCGINNYEKKKKDYNLGTGNLGSWMNTLKIWTHL